MGAKHWYKVAVLFALLCLLTPARPALADTAVRMEGGLLSKGDVLWLGQIDLTDDLGTYDGPIPWLVLDPVNAYDGTSGRATVISRYALALTLYGMSADGWQTTTIRSAMRTMANNRSIFSQSEYDLMIPLTTSGPFGLQEDRLFPLLEADVSDSGYLPTNESRIAYAITKHSVALTYWLRYYLASIYKVIDVTGDVQTYLLFGVQYPMRPAASLETSDIALYASPAGKLDGDAGLAINGPLPTGEYVLTLFDASRSFYAYVGDAPATLGALKFGEGGATVTSAGGTVDVSYDGATLGANEYISAMVTGGASGTDVLFYGRVRHIGEDGDESGTVAINVPAGLTPGGAYTLRVFSEQHNTGGDGPSRLTDYISDYSEIRLTGTGAGDVPATGDAQNPLFWFGLLALATAGLAGLWMARRIRRARG